MAVNKFFNAEFYLAQNADLIRAGFNTADGGEQLWNHYEQYGAQESTTVASRAPNPWFDVNYYLAANPDLNKAGLTAADALNHYATYGINEGREFSATISASDFNAATYAADNADVRDAYGIEEGATLTAENKADLLSHYLAYGYAENRKGAGEIADKVQADNVVTVVTDGATGTIMNDKFVVDTTSALAADAVIDGLGGTDTVVFKTAVAANILTLQNVEKVVVAKEVLATNVAFDSKQVLETITLDKGFTGTVTANFATAAVAGSADVLNVVANDAATTLITNGIETVNLELGKDVATFAALSANTAKGDTLTVNLEGGATTGFTLASLTTDGSTALKNIVIDGSELAGKFAGVTTLTAQALNVTNVTIKGSNAEANTFSATGGVKAANNLTLVAGSKGDTFNSTDAIDTFVAGAGKDTFTIDGAKSVVRLDAKDEKIAGVDTIEGFGAGDKVKGTGVTELTSGSVLETEDAFLTYVKTVTDNDNTAFEYDGDTYVLLAGKADLAEVELVKIAGVSIDSLKVATAADTGYTAGDLIFA